MVGNKYYNNGSHPIQISISPLFLFGLSSFIVTLSVHYGKHISALKVLKSFKDYIYRTSMLQVTNLFLSAKTMLIMSVYYINFAFIIIE